jgi:hypothetical protein
MPAKSKAQARYMGVVAGGKKKVKGLSPEKAKEFLEGVKVSNLPEKAKPKKSNLSARYPTMKKRGK